MPLFRVIDRCSVDTHLFEGGKKMRRKIIVLCCIIGFSLSAVLGSSEADVGGFLGGAAKGTWNGIKHSGEHLYERGKRSYRHLKHEANDFTKDPIGETIRGFDIRNLSEIMDDGLRRAQTEPVKITGDVIGRTLGDNAENKFYDVMGYIKGLSVYPHLRSLYFVARASSFQLPNHVVQISRPYFKNENESRALRQARYYIDATKVFSKILKETGNKALTFYDVVIFREGSYPEKRNPENYEFWAEELYHVAQYLDRGLDTFLLSYATSSATSTIVEILEAIRDGRLPNGEAGYWGNTLEIDAQAKARKVKEDLMSKYGVGEKQVIRVSHGYAERTNLGIEDIQSFQTLAKSLPDSTPKQKSKRAEFFLDLSSVFYSTAQDANAVRAVYITLDDILQPSDSHSALKSMNKALLGMNEVYRTSQRCELSNEELTKIKQGVIGNLKRFWGYKDIMLLSELLLGRIELLNGNEDAALGHFVSSFNINHYNVEGFAEAGRILAGMQNFQYIENLAAQSLQNLNTPNVILRNHGLVYDQSFFSQGAVMKRNKATADILFIKGWLYEDNDYILQAVPNYRASIFVNPVEPSGYERMAACLEKIDNYRDASAWSRESASIYFYLHADHKAAENKGKEITCGSRAGLLVYGPKGDLAKLYLLADSRLVKDSKPLKNISEAVRWMKSSTDDMERYWGNAGPINRPQGYQKFIADHLEAYCLAKEVYKAAGDYTKEKKMDEAIQNIAFQYGVNSQGIEYYKKRVKTLRRR
jgi:hypothetical protein